jgi:hypothetical protein
MSIAKSKSNIRVKHVMKRNNSQVNLRPLSQHRKSLREAEPAEPSICHNDKTLADVFEIRAFFFKVNGRETNNIVELYEFYKKHIEKR